MNRLPRPGQRRPLPTVGAPRGRHLTAVPAAGGTDRGVAVSAAPTRRGVKPGEHSRVRVPWTRLGLLVAGSVLLGCGLALLVSSRLGMVPLDVLHLGVADRFGFTFGGGILAVQATLLMTYLPLRITPGIGTIVAFVLPAGVADLLLWQLPRIDALPTRVLAFAVGAVMFCLGVATYLHAELGRLPRDGIMLAAAGERPGHPASARRIAVVRIGLDIVFVATGTLLLGVTSALNTGALSVGTAVLALGTGPLIAALLRAFRTTKRSRAG